MRTSEGAALVALGVNRREFLGAGLAVAPVLLRGCRDSRFAAAPAAPREPLALVTADTESCVVEVSLARGRVLRRLATVSGPHGIQSGPGGVAVLAHTDAGAVSLLEGRPVRVRRVLRGFSAPRYAAVAPSGEFAFVTDSGSGEVAVVDLRVARVVRRVEVGAHARHVTLAPDGRVLWVGLGSSAAEVVVVDVADPAHPRVARRIRPPFLAHDVGFTPDGRHVWVTAGRDGRVAIYGAASAVPEVTLPAAAAPQHVTFGAGRAFVASGAGRTVQAFSLAGRLLRTTTVPLGSYNVQRGAGRVLTPSLDMGALTALDSRGGVLWEVQAAHHAHDVCVV